MFVLQAEDVLLASFDDVFPLLLVGRLHWSFLTFSTGIPRVEKVKNGVESLQEVDCTVRFAELLALKAFFPQSLIESATLELIDLRRKVDLHFFVFAIRYVQS